MSTIVTRSGKGSPLTHAEVDSNFTNLNTDKLELSGGTLTGTLNFGDNVKAQFGASADLAIFHDGSNSYIQEFGTGNLILGAGNAFEVRSSDNVTTGAVFNAYGSVDLNHNGSTKLSTTSTGIDVTGTVVADGGSFTGDMSFGDNVKATFGASADLQVFHDGSNSWINEIGTGNLLIGGGNEVRITSPSAGEFMATFSNNGPVNLYYDNSKKLETSSGGIAVTGSVSTTADVIVGSGRSGGVYLENSGRNNDFFASNRTASLPSEWATVRINQEAAYTGLKINGDTSQTGNYFEITDSTGSDEFVVRSSGNVGINTSSPTEKLEVNGTAKATTFKFSNWTITESGGSLYFATGGTNKMKLDASGNLDVVGSVNANATIT